MQIVFGQRKRFCCPTCGEDWTAGWQSKQELGEFLAGGINSLGRRIAGVRCISCKQAISMESAVNYLRESA